MTPKLFGSRERVNWDVPVVLRNRGGRAVAGELRMHGLVDEWQVVGKAVARVSVAPGAEFRHTFRMRAEAGVTR